jgi:hypothetical protein
MAMFGVFVACNHYCCELKDFDEMLDILIHKHNDP